MTATCGRFQGWKSIAIGALEPGGGGGSVVLMVVDAAFTSICLNYKNRKMFLDKNMEEPAGGDVQEWWKIMGFKFQVAAEHLLKRMGYRILKAQQDSDLRKSAEAFREIINPCVIGEYLWNYSDYIVIKKTLLLKKQVYIVDVKTKPCVWCKVRDKWETSLDNNFSFTKKEIEFYRKSTIPVLILIIIYQDTGDLKGLGPVYYRLVKFSDFQFPQYWEGGALPLKDLKEGCKKLTSLETYDILCQAKALNVIEVGSGYIRCI